MYICLECGYIFDSPKIYSEKHGLDTPPFEQIEGCPKCGGDFTEAIKCAICGEYIVDRYYHLCTDEDVCDECCIRRTIGD